MSLAIITDPSKLLEVVNQQKAAGRQVGLVPPWAARALCNKARWGLTLL